MKIKLKDREKGYIFLSIILCQILELKLKCINIGLIKNINNKCKNWLRIVSIFHIYEFNFGLIKNTLIQGYVGGESSSMFCFQRQTGDGSNGVESFISYKTDNGNN